MKRLSLLSLVLFALLLQAGAQTTAKQVKADDGKLPYKAVLNTNFSIGSPQYSRTVLNLWKDWDNNTLDNSAAYFADDITGEMADGSVVRGKKAFLSTAKEYRSQFSKVESEIISYATLKGEDGKDENIVSIWGNETSTKKDGTQVKLQLHEVWVFNKEGQIVFMKQFISQPPKNEN